MFPIEKIISDIFISYPLLYHPLANILLTPNKKIRGFPRTHDKFHTDFLVIPVSSADAADLPGNDGGFKIAAAVTAF